MMGDAFDSDQYGKQFYSNANGNHASSTSLTLVDHELQLLANCVTSIFSNSITSVVAKGNIENDEHDSISRKPRG